MILRTIHTEICKSFVIPSWPVTDRINPISIGADDVLIQCSRNSFVRWFSKSYELIYGYRKARKISVAFVLTDTKYAWSWSKSTRSRFLSSVNEVCKVIYWGETLLYFTAKTCHSTTAHSKRRTTEHRKYRSSQTSKELLELEYWNARNIT